ncbi:MAG: DUF1674 domain-containing protein [Rhodospirillaceae bacterium]|nr:DUF1674 domain-containing protein [Rhodospirillaceae bacterium]
MKEKQTTPKPDKTPENNAENAKAENTGEKKPQEFGGPKGPEPTRYGDWEQKGRCTDF